MFRYFLGLVVIVGTFSTSACGDDPGALQGTLLVHERALCGDGRVTASEVCEHDDLAGVDCRALGYDGGVLNCSKDCRGYDESACVVTTVCGDGRRDDLEACDGPDFGDLDCATFGAPGGVLICGEQCDTVSLAACAAPPRCGNDLLDDGELCDGADVRGTTCYDLGLGAGPVACGANCLTFDLGACRAQP